MKKQPLPNQQRLENARLKRLCAYERKARQQGFQTIAGVDEAGRGPLAGPVVAAACILPDGIRLPGINDSKQLTAEERERLYEAIKNNPDILSGVGIVEAVIIDQINILQATFRAMTAAIIALAQKPDYVLIDGNQLPRLEIPCEGIVEGDTLSQSIMAAAIIAKVTRDRIMREQAKRWPGYGFDEHKGYPTAKHIEALKRLGPCPIHRRSYEPVRLVS
jgi:ribonuclease HII